MLAYELHKEVEDIQRMGLDEYTTWLAFFKLVNDNRDKTSGGKNGNKPRRH